jgi:serine/threonine protein kinase
VPGPITIDDADIEVVSDPATAARRRPTSAFEAVGAGHTGSSTRKRPRADVSSSGYSGPQRSELAPDEESPRQLVTEGPLPPHERAFGPYTLVRRLAFGGMGEVFLARHPSTGLVVVKRVLAHMKRDDKHRQMFLDEARLQRLLRSPHIVQVSDVGDVDGHVFLAMEHVHGPSWRGLVDRSRQRRQHIPVAYVVEMMIQACDALAWAHALEDEHGHPLRIVHRDINPHNVLVTYDGVVKVIDFGIAKSELREQQTETGTIKGKFAYMSPEQSAADPLDQRSDLFALGICLYELLTLQNPFKRGNIVLSLEAIQKTQPKPLAEVRPGAAILDPIVERMLRKNPDDRFFDCSEVRDALRQMQVDGLIPEPPRPLAAWLHELYAAEIAEHEAIIDELRDAGEHDTVDTLAAPPTTTGAWSAPPAVTAHVEPPLSPTLPDGHGTGPTGALQLSPPSPWPLAAAVGVGTAVILVVVLLAGRQFIAPTVAPSTMEMPVAAPTTSGPAVLPAEPAHIAPPPVVEVPPPAVEPPPPVADTPKVTKRPGKVAGPAIARLVVAADGFVVKGARLVPADGSATLIVDDGDAPFKLRLRVRAGASGGLLDLDTKPWAIVRVDQIGKGRSPLSDVVLDPGRKTQVSLQNPAGATMDLAVTYIPMGP